MLIVFILIEDDLKYVMAVAQFNWSRAKNVYIQMRLFNYMLDFFPMAYKVSPLLKDIICNISIVDDVEHETEFVEPFIHVEFFVVSFTYRE